MVQITAFTLLAAVGLAAAAPAAMPCSDSSCMSSSSSSSCTDSSCMSSSSSSGCSGSSCDMSSDESSMMMDSSTMMMDSMMMDSSTMMMDSSTMMMDTTSTMMMDTTSTMAYMSTSTAMSYSTATYGSGSSSWGGSGYNDCVQQCMASFGAPQATYMPGTATASSGSYGTGATHTVIVAPSQGVLRYVPFAVNASVGDTIKFMWGANNHTVTKSSQLELCNKTSDAPFASGEQNKSFVFTQVVNDTNPTFFYCGTPTHCEKGMFGIINPPNAAGSPSAASAMMASMASNNSDVAAMAAYSSQMTSNSPMAAAWGSNMDMSGMPSWSNQVMAENIMFTRNVLAANPDIMNADGSVDLGNAGSAPLMIPQDITAALNAASSSSSAASSSTAAASSSGSSTASSSAASSTASKSGAGSLSASGALVGVVAVVATFFAL